MSQAVNQHFVPQFYLRAFGPGSGKIYVTDIYAIYHGGPIVSTKKPIESVAAHDHLYSLPLASGHYEPEARDGTGWDETTDAINDAVDGKASKLWARLDKAREGINLAPGSDDRALLAFVIANFHFRNKRMVQVAKHQSLNPEAAKQLYVPQLSESDVEQLFSEIAGVPVDLGSSKTAVEDRAEFHRWCREGILVFAKILLDMHWTVDYFPTGAASGPLFTSDTPVVIVNAANLEATALDHPNALLMFPITRRHVLLATARRTMTPDGSFRKIDDGQVQAEMWNQQIAHFSTREAYSSFDLANFRFLND